MGNGEVVDLNKQHVMREIKFRAWDGEKMWDNPYHFEVNYLSNSPMPHRAYNDWCDLEDGRSFPCILMQYTGLNDKNGKEIYEGDIVCLAGYGDYVCEFPFLELYQAHWENDIGEIKGNIHQTPELL